MSAPGFWELVVLAVLALLIFGPERLPTMARNAGKMIAKFKAEASATLDELKVAAEVDEVRDVARELKAASADLRKVGGELKLDADVTGVAGSRLEEKPVSASLPRFDPDTP